MTSIEPDVAHDAHRDERTPLLSSYHPQEQRAAVAGTAASTLLSDIDQERAAKRMQTLVVAIMLVVCTIIDFGGGLTIAPQAVVFESIICNKYYQDGQVQYPDGFHWQAPKYDCDVNPVQSELAFVLQLMETFGSIPAILLAVPYGVLADRIGRKPVMLLSLAMLVVQELSIRVISWFPGIFPLRLVWATPLILVVGGGTQVTVSMIYTMVADIASAKDRANIFFLLVASALLGDILATPVAAWMMQTSPWLPLIVAFGLYFTGVLCIIFLLPETLPQVLLDHGASCKATSTSEHDIQSVEEHTSQPHDETASTLAKNQSLLGRVYKVVQTVMASTAFLFQNLNVMLLLTATFISALAKQSTSFQLQYVKKRFSWSYAEASFLISLRGCINLALLLAILPFLSKLLLDRLHYSTTHKDLVFVRSSAITLTAGAALLAVAVNAPLLITAISLFALGSGLDVTARSLMTSLVAPTHVGTLYTAAAVMRASGMLAAGPILAVTFKRGLEGGGALIGLPWLVVALLLAVVTVAVWCVRLGRGPEERLEEEVESDDEETALLRD